MSRVDATNRKPLILLLLVFLTSYGCAAPWARRKDPLLNDIAQDVIDADASSRISPDVASSDRGTSSDRGWFRSPAGKNEPVARAKYEEGQRLFREQKYAEARASFEESADAFDNSPLQEDAMFMVAESYFLEDKYPEAFNSYDALLNKYKRSRHLDTAVKRQFHIGKRWEQQHFESPEFFLKPNLTDKKRPFNDTLGRARKAFTNVRLNHPTGPLADDSLMATANSYFVRGKYRDADYYYDTLRNEYPNSEHQYEAHMLGVQAKIRRYQGPDYDGTPLIEAKELVEQTVRQFTRMSPEDRSRLDAMYKQVTTGLAQRDYHMAQYYERKGYYGAARLYHEQVKNEFKQTAFAEKAHERLDAVKDKPNVPPPRFTWLSGLFPEQEKAALQLPSGLSDTKTSTMDLP